ncbi:MAG: MFS transporter [Bacteroidales bacterium]|jgi:fucose permease|nr:MFS transporter [Bacteroidales bacterium]
MKNSNKKAVVPIMLVFLIMGFGDVVGPMVSLVKDSFGVSNFLAQLLTFSGFIMFGILSVPMGIYQDKKGKKHTLLIGLSIAFIGLLIPIIGGMYGKLNIEGNTNTLFYIILVSVLMLGAGATILQVAGNPVMRDVSPEGRYSSNLSFAQSIKAIGSSLGFLLPPLAAMYLNLDWTLLFPIYSFIVLITLIWVSGIKIEEKKVEGEKPASLKSCLMLLKNKFVLIMVLGIFIYVGAEVSMSSQVPILMKDAFGISGYGLWVSWSLFFLPILIGRFVGSAVLRVLKAKVFLTISALLAIAGIALMFIGHKYLAFTGIILIGFGFSNIFPLIFSITIDKLPERANELSGLMVTAIVGGALIPPITGLVADHTSTLFGFIVPMICIFYIIIISLLKFNKVK